MDKLAWDEGYRTGMPEIDDVHMLFVSLVNKIYNYLQEQRDEDFLKRTLDELLKYTEFHFASEENMMISVAYPNLEHHRGEHEKLMLDLRNILFNVSIEPDSIDELVQFLDEWISSHIYREDKALAKFIQSKQRA